MSIVHNGREKKLFTIILALRKGLKALFEALHGSSIKGGGGGVELQVCSEHPPATVRHM